LIRLGAAVDFALTDEQRMLREAVRRLMDSRATPQIVRRLDEEQAYPYELYDAWVENGVLQMPFPSSHGGLDGGVIEVAIISEELARKSFDLFTAFSCTVFCGLTLSRHGTEEQKQAWLPALMDGSKRMSISMSEPDAGSDLSGIRTTATKVPGGWLLNGRKLWATGAGARDNVINVYARSRPDVDYREGLSLFLVPNDAPGVSLHKLQMLGRRSVGTFEIVFENVRVPDDCLVGGEHQGWECLKSGLQFERITSTAGYCGAAQSVVDMAVQYAKDRRQFGKHLIDHQAIGHMIADMQTEVFAARLMMWHAAQQLATKGDALGAISMAKLFGSETYVKVANQGMQVLGAFGYSMEYDMQRHYRDARSTTIGAGTSQIQRNLIAHLLKTNRM
jgi:alkylation response protein AidB-like acyl-CoA dehydrogenase